MSSIEGVSTLDTDQFANGGGILGWNPFGWGENHTPDDDNYDYGPRGWSPRYTPDEVHTETEKPKLHLGDMILAWALSRVLKKKKK